MTRLAGELGINVSSAIHELTHTHWAIKEADLFKVLLFGLLFRIRREWNGHPGIPCFHGRMTLQERPRFILGCSAPEYFPSLGVITA